MVFVILYLAEEKSAKLVKIQLVIMIKISRKSHFQEWWEGLKSEKRVQIIHGTLAKM